MCCEIVYFICLLYFDNCIYGKGKKFFVVLLDVILKVRGNIGLEKMKKNFLCYF